MHAHFAFLFARTFPTKSAALRTGSADCVTVRGSTISPSLRTALILSLEYELWWKPCDVYETETSGQESGICWDWHDVESFQSLSRRTSLTEKLWVLERCDILYMAWFLTDTRWRQSYNWLDCQCVRVILLFMDRPWLLPAMHSQESEILNNIFTRFCISCGIIWTSDTGIGSRYNSIVLIERMLNYKRHICVLLIVWK